MRSNSNSGYGLPLPTLVFGCSIGLPTLPHCLFIWSAESIPSSAAYSTNSFASF